MSWSDVAFIAWWYGAGIVLAAATWITLRRGEAIDYEAVLKVLLVGIAAGLVLYLAPNGIATIDSPTDFKLRLLAALAIAWAAAYAVTRSLPQAQGRSAVALAAFIGVNAPPLALVLSATMVCGGHPNCL
jgi:hypothetical protein